MNFDSIDRNLKECWELYKEYLEEFRKTHYSDAIPMDFVDYCSDELYECPNCGEIVIKDDQEKLYYDFNSDDVCDDCIECGGYYE